MYFCQLHVVRSSVDGPKIFPTVVLLLVDGLPMIDRCNTEVFQAVHIFYVNARRRPIWEIWTG